MDIYGLFQCHWRGSAQYHGLPAGQAPPGQEAGKMGTGILPEEQSPGGSEKAVFCRGPGRAGTAEKTAGRITLAFYFRDAYNEGKGV